MGTTTKEKGGGETQSDSLSSADFNEQLEAILARENISEVGRQQICDLLQTTTDEKQNRAQTDAAATIILKELAT